MRGSFLLKVIAIVQARMGSTRLPGKVLKKIKDKFVLDYVIDRLRMCKNLDDIILATTTNKKDDKLEQYAIDKEIKYYRGSEEDVLSRYYSAARKLNVDVIVRITSDCPLIDPEIVDEVIKKHIETKADYTSNIIKRTFPRGLDVEVFNYNVLKNAFDNAKEKYQREHVTPYIYEHPERFKILLLDPPLYLQRNDIRLTIDVMEDYILYQKLFEEFGDLTYVDIKDIIAFLDQNCSIKSLNAHVKQKKYWET